MNTRTVEIFDHLASLGDPTRTRTLLLLDGHELTVTELCGIMQLPQSTVSRHLKALGDGGRITSRQEGRAHHYTVSRARGRAGEVRSLSRPGRGPRRRPAATGARTVATRSTRRTACGSSSVSRSPRVR